MVVWSFRRCGMAVCLASFCTPVVLVNGFSTKTLNNASPTTLQSTLPQSFSWCLSSSSSSASDSSLPSSSATVDTTDPLGLTPELRRMTDAFASIPDEKVRYKQLIYMANELQPVSDDVLVPGNKVPGCLSTVHVACYPTEEDPLRVNFVGESDGILTKGLVAFLVRGLSGHTAEEIERVNPEFINEAQISQSLTPGRNNGFLNMLATMKQKAKMATTSADNSGAAGESLEEEEQADDIVTSFEPVNGKPMYNAIMSTLITVLKPQVIELVDNSSQHAGHAGAKGWEESGESHFDLTIVAEAFEDVSLVNRHKLVYMLLGDVMEKIHALQIHAKAPSEV